MPSCERDKGISPFDGDLWRNLHPVTPDCPRLPRPSCPLAFSSAIWKRVLDVFPLLPRMELNFRFLLKKKITTGLSELEGLTSAPRWCLELTLPAAPAAARSRATDHQHSLMLPAPASNPSAQASVRCLLSAVSPLETRASRSPAATARGAPVICSISMRGFS